MASTAVSLTRSPKTLGAAGFLAISIGGQIGVGWITFVGYWLGDAGAVSTLLGFALGAVLMSGVAACHAELAGMMPISGGEIVYAKKIFGRMTALIVGWFMLFLAVAMLSFEALSLGWMLETLFPALQAPALFQVLGADVTLPQLITSQVSIWSIYAINKRGLHVSARTGEVLTIAKVAVVAVLVLGGIFLGEPVRSLELPAGTKPASMALATLGVFAASPFWIGGFSSIAKLAGDRNAKTSMNTVGILMVVTVPLCALIYMGIVLACAAAAPIDQTTHAQLPAVFAADALFTGSWAGRSILVAGIAGILSIMNAVLLSSSRVMRVFREIAWPTPETEPQSVGKRDDFLLIVVASAVCSFAGIGALVPLNNTGAMAAIICYFVMCLATRQIRLSAPALPRPFKVPGGIAMLTLILIAMGCTGMFLLVQPLFTVPFVLPTEWLIFGIWTAFGVLIGGLTGGRRRRAPTPIDGSGACD